uniref:Ectonucleoside triphosphate diphosphohydrolase 5 n=1 Tax=Arion vulgaris TaxID=1028688 RepID=A0A0B6ZTZ1_9EUPU
MDGDGVTSSMSQEMDEDADSFQSNSITSSLHMDASLSIRAIIFAVITIFIAVVLLGSIPALLSETPVQDIYSVVFDAGSTGSRVFVFHFKTKGTGIFGVSLEDEVFQSVEPGISFYALNPEEIEHSLRPLLQHATESVPKDYHSLTLVTFKATAGLRLLQKAKADKIISVVRNLLVSTPFYLPDLSRVEIMSGEEEGLFAWISVNFLLDLIWNAVHENTVTIFDLGGGSVQISFEISRLNVLGNILIRDVVKMLLLNADFNVFTKSYLGYGLKSARLGVMGGKEGPNGVVTYDHDVSDKLDTDVLLLSPCYTLGTNFTFLHNDVSYIVKGQNPASYVLPRCREAVDQFVQTANFIQNSEMSQRDIHLFSYFFDVARWAKLIPWNEYRRNLTPEDFYKAATKYCHEDDFEQKYPFLCIDLLYIHSLLTVGVGLKPDKKLSVETQLLGRQVSWTLGAALCTLSDKISFSPIL